MHARVASRLMRYTLNSTTSARRLWICLSQTLSSQRPQPPSSGTIRPGMSAPQITKRLLHRGVVAHTCQGGAQRAIFSLDPDILSYTFKTIPLELTKGPLSLSSFRKNPAPFVDYVLAVSLKHLFLGTHVRLTSSLTTAHARPQGTSGCSSPSSPCRVHTLAPSANLATQWSVWC